MKRFVSAVAVLSLLAPIAGVQADSVSQVIYITAVVPPMRNIIVDDQDRIVEITSNTPENITPKVYVRSFQDGVEVALTPTILRDYEAKIKDRDLQSADLHFSPQARVVAKAHPSTVFTVLQHISLLRWLPRL